MLGGAAPIPASSGQTIRYRLNRAGDRDLNCALHTIVPTRLQHDPATRAYERGSIIVTSDRGFEAWGEILGDAMVAAVLIDRLVHHAHIITLKGKSYRLRERGTAPRRRPDHPDLCTISLPELCTFRFLLTPMNHDVVASLYAASVGHLECEVPAPAFHKEAQARRRESGAGARPSADHAGRCNGDGLARRGERQHVQDHAERALRGGLSR